MQRRFGLLLVVIPTLVAAAFVLADSAEQARPELAPKTLEAPEATPAEREDAQSQTPQPSSGEVIGVPMLA